MKLEYKLSSGQWADVNENRNDEFLQRAANHWNKGNIEGPSATPERMLTVLQYGDPIGIGSDWCDKLRMKPEPKTKPKTNPSDYPNGRRLGCGCIVYWKSQVLAASIGTTCSNCYDDMS